MKIRKCKWVLKNISDCLYDDFRCYRYIYTYIYIFIPNCFGVDILYYRDHNYCTKHVQ